MRPFAYRYIWLNTESRVKDPEWIESKDKDGYMSAGTNVGAIRLEDSAILTAVFKNLAVGVVVCDSTGKFVFFSLEAERILGVGAMRADSAEWSTAYGCYLPDMVTPYPPEELPLARAMQGEEGLHRLIFVRNPQRPAGLWIDVSGTPLRDSSGKPCGGIVIFSDVTVPETLLHSKAAVDVFLAHLPDPSHLIEEQNDLVSDRFAQFRAMYGQMAAAVERTADSVLITDSRGIIEYVNPAFEKITGYSIAEVLGRKPSIVKSGEHDAAFYCDLWRRLNSGNPFHGIIINRNKAGDLFWSDQTISPIKDQTGATTHFVSVWKDMTAILKKRDADYQMALAREVQQRYYGTTTFSLPGFDVAAAAHPADATGGDYFDFIPHADGSLYIVIADIAGHGFGAALVMAEVRASLRACATTMAGISSILNCLNQTLLDTLGGNRYVTIFLGRIDPQNRVLEYASAGHEQGYLLRDSGEVGAVLASTGPPLGLFSGQMYSLSPPVLLEHGDAIVLLTDGITESTGVDDAMFGTEGALDFIRSHRQSSSKELAEGLYAAARNFAGGRPQLDDMMSVVCKVDHSPNA